MDPLIIAIIVAVFTLIVLFSGIPIAFGLSFVSIALLVAFEGFQMLDARFTRMLVSESGTEVSASFFGTNLLDEVARNHTSFIKDEVPLPGRNFGVKFKGTF